MPHLFFCCETECDGEAHVYGGRCDGCFEAELEYLRELHNPTRCDNCHERINCSIDSDALYSASHVFCHRSCYEAWLAKHKCSGEFDFHRGCYVCDDNDDPRCPSYRQYYCEGRRNSVVSPRAQKCCADCGVPRTETEPVLECDWYCHPCWQTRLRACDECGKLGRDGRATCLCWADEEDLARMDRDAALHR